MRILNFAALVLLPTEAANLIRKIVKLRRAWDRGCQITQELLYTKPYTAMPDLEFTLH